MATEAHSFLFPTIVAMPRGYDLTFVLPTASIAQYLTVKDTDLITEYSVYSEGKLLSQVRRVVPFRDGKFVGTEPEAVVLREEDYPQGESPTFLEFTMKDSEDRPTFSTRIVHGWYSIYSKPGKKSFFSDNAVKYGSPPIISMIAQFGKYVDGYPVVHVDRTRDLSESMLVINPYKRPIVADIVSHDQRRLPRTRVPGMSARWMRFSDLLRDGEDKWLGQVQLTASNRLIAFETKHSFSDPTRITDHEHLDPYRADPTHMKATLKARIIAGAAFRRLKQAIRPASA
jgi:hypothetical protein